MMMRRDHLRHLRGGTHGVEDLQMRPNHLSNIHNQIHRLFLHVVKEEAAIVIEKDMRYHVCTNRIL